MMMIMTIGMKNDDDHVGEVRGKDDDDRDDENDDFAKMVQ